MERKKLKIKTSENKTSFIEVQFSKSSPWKVTLSDNNIEFDGNDLFSCLIKLRTFLEREGKKILFNGSRIDAYPSRMARQMGGGRKIYILKKGKQATNSDLVDVFDEVEEEELIGTVEEQKNFYATWIESL